MKKFILLFFTLLLSLPLLAQLEVKEGSFKEVPGFVNINTDKMYDDNDKPYAVLKIKTENISSKERHELSFKGDAQTFFEVEYKDGEVWLYISYYASYIKISHEEFSSTEFHFPFDMKPKCGYELTIVNKSAPISNGWASLTIKTTPYNGANIILNGRPLDQKTPYTNEMIPSGNYEIVVYMDKFKTTTYNTDVLNGENKVVEIEMPLSVGKLTVKTNPVGATVYIDGKNYGITPIVINNLLIGNHNLKIKMPNYNTYTTVFTLNDDDDLLFDQSLQVSSYDGTINGIYSVAPNKRIKFSRGNLQYKASTNTWRFAEFQWEYIGSQNSNISPKYNEWIDLFGWGTGDNPTKSSVLTDDYKTFVDWGNNNIIGGDKTHWYTLSKNEWDYLFQRRETKSGIRYAKAVINDIYGVIILPDNWERSYYRLKKTNKYKAMFNSNIISLSDWVNKLEANGAVFLPASGLRYGKFVKEEGVCGCYWSSTHYQSFYSFEVYFDNSMLYLDDAQFSTDGRSVRLVCPMDD